MDERGIHPEQAQESDAALSVARRLYCQLLVNSVFSPHLDTSKPDLNSDLLRAFEKSMTNVENRVKVIFERSMPSGEATAAEREKCVADFQKCLHYMEEYLYARFKDRNVDHVYDEMEVEEPATGGPQNMTAQRAMARVKKQLQEELDVENSLLLDGLVQYKLVSDWERESILAKTNSRAKAAELLRAVTPRLDQTRLQQQFLPLLRQDHAHLAEALSRALEEEKEVGGSESKCCVCQFNEVVEVKRLAPHLSEVVSPSLDSDLSNPALTNTSKMRLLKEEVNLEQVIESLREPYPALHQQFCSERVTALKCFCARLREAPTSDCVDGLESHSVTDDDDVACMSDLQSMLGDADSRLPENPSKMMSFLSSDTDSFDLMAVSRALEEAREAWRLEDECYHESDEMNTYSLYLKNLGTPEKWILLAFGVIAFLLDLAPRTSCNNDISSPLSSWVIVVCDALVVSAVTFAIDELYPSWLQGRRLRGSCLICHRE